MEAKDAFRLRKETFGQSCIHATIEKEYNQGVDVHAWVCSKCGTEFGNKEVWEKIHQNQKQSVTV